MIRTAVRVCILVQLVSKHIDLICPLYSRYLPLSILLSLKSMMSSILSSLDIVFNYKVTLNIFLAFLWHLFQYAFFIIKFTFKEFDILRSDISEPSIWLHYDVLIFHRSIMYRILNYLTCPLYPSLSN